MNTIEEIKNLYIEPFNCEKLNHFKKVVMDSYESFIEFANFGNGLDKGSSEYKVICKYHIESYISDSNYKKEFWKYSRMLRLDESKT